MNLHQLDFPVNYGDGPGGPDALRAFGMTHAQGMGGAIRHGTGSGNESRLPRGLVSKAIANDYKEIGKSL